MTIHAKVFPLDGNLLSSGVRYSTDVIIGANGQEVRNSNWQDPLHVFNAAFAVTSRADAHTLKSWFHTCRGREIGFLLQAGDDFAIPQTGTTPQNIGTGDGSETEFQIYKRYSDGNGNNYDRPITRPSSTGTDISVYVSGGGQTQTTHYTWSSTTGIITFVSPPANGAPITVYLKKFYVPVRFDIDELDIDMLMWWATAVENGDYSLHQPPNIPMIEIRE